ncbi:heme ABC exporter ATP-binding protein CcmA [Chloroflexi bacterium TSY]|nr:heme ABC exporter ATP-binding protein CcmA [Chloroflexi bacterium TSY]
MTLICVQKLRKRYGSKAVLKDVELTIDAGQVVALLGANGAGKTTLMRSIAGLTKPDRGSIQLGGATFRTARHELRRYIGFVGHAPLLYDTLSGWENLQFFARLYDMQQPEARIEALMREVELWSRRRDLVRTYSRGMKQRLAIARTVLHDPPVLLLDEPDTGLDQASMEMLHRIIRQLGVNNRAILLSTHQLDQALIWADQICILADGHIVHQPKSQELNISSLRTLYLETSHS